MKKQEMLDFIERCEENIGKEIWIFRYEKCSKNDVLDEIRTEIQYQCKMKYSQATANQICDVAKEFVEDLVSDI